MKTFHKVWLSISLIAIGFGLTMVILAVGCGATWKEGGGITYSIHESYTDIERIDMEFEYEEVTIVQGDVFSIDSDSLYNDSLESYVLDGTWYVRENNNKNKYIEIIGNSFSVGELVQRKDDSISKIIITIPKDFTAEDITLSIGAGYINADRINALKGNFKVGAGELILKEALLNNITLDCGIGHVWIEGAITGDNDIICGVGKVELTLSGEERDYSYEVSNNIGEVVIGNRSYDSFINKVSNQENSDNNLYLECNIGHISVDFE